MIQGLHKAMSSRVGDLKSMLADRQAGKAVFTHIPTNLAKFDHQFGGVEIGILTLIVGHTGDGKTALLGHLAKAAATAGFGVLLVLLEDPQDKLADRYLAAIMGTSANKLARLDFGSPERLDAALAVSESWTSRVGLVSGDYSATEVLAIVDKTETVGGAPLKLVVVDYAQSFAEDEGRMEQVCASTARGLNARAMARGFAAVLGSQVKTEVLARGRSRWERTLASGEPDERGFVPGKGDVMWSRRLEQYSKACWYLFRPGRWRRACGDGAAKDNVFEIHIGKANFSAEGGEAFTWNGEACTIS